MTDRKPQDQDKFVLRLPDGMRDRIKAAAEANSRSMNAEIVATLEEAYPAPPTFYDVEKVHKIIAEMRDLLAIIQAPTVDAGRKANAQAKIDQLETRYQEMRRLK